MAKKVWTADARAAFAKRMAKYRGTAKRKKTRNSASAKNPRSGPVMMLKHFLANNAWGYIFGSTIATASHITMDGEKLFNSRAEAVAAAKRVGLSVDKTGKVRTIEKNPPRRKASYRATRQNPPRSKGYCVFARKGNDGPRMRWTGLGFSATAKPAVYPTIAAAREEGSILYKHFYNQIEKAGIRLWAAEKDSQAMP